MGASVHDGSSKVDLLPSTRRVLVIDTYRSSSVDLLRRRGVPGTGETERETTEEKEGERDDRGHLLKDGQVCGWIHVGGTH